MQPSLVFGHLKGKPINLKVPDLSKISLVRLRIIGTCDFHICLKAISCLPHPPPEKKNRRLPSTMRDPQVSIHCGEKDEISLVLMTMSHF